MIKNIFISLTAGILIFGFNTLSFAVSCGHGSEGHQTAQAGEAISQPAAKEPVNVGNKICPVSGEEVGKGGMQPATYEYQGKIYNFCCPACVDEFKKDPEKYIKKVEEELKGESKKTMQEEKSMPESSTGAGEHGGHQH